MNIVFLLIPIAIILVAIGTWAFFYSVKTGQFDDLESPAHRILFDDDEDMIPEEARIKKKPTAPAPSESSDEQDSEK